MVLPISLIFSKCSCLKKTYIHKNLGDFSLDQIIIFIKNGRRNP